MDHAGQSTGHEDMRMLAPEFEKTAPPLADPAAAVDASPVSGPILGCNPLAYGQLQILQRPVAAEPQLQEDAGTDMPMNATTPLRSATRFASPPVTIRRRPRTSSTWTLGEFLTAATKGLNSALPTPARRRRQLPLNFSPRRGRSASVAKAKTSAPPTAERRSQIQVLRTLGIIGTDQRITAVEMKAYQDLFAAPIPMTVLAAIAALVDRELPADPTTAPITTVIAGSQIAV
jgi:hypothetical protein